MAVKVQYPGAAKALQADLKNIDALLTAVGGVMGIAKTGFTGRGYFDEVATELTNETDYRREARNAVAYRAHVAAFPELVVPEVIESHVAGRVLTLELVEGDSLADLLENTSAESNDLRFKASAGLVAALYGPLLTDGTIHADPHPGNFMVLADGQLAVLDFGAVKQWSQRMTSAARTVYRGLLEDALPDIEGLLRSSGFDVGGPVDKALPVLRELFGLLRGPVAEPEFDFGATKIAAEFEAVARRNVSVLMGIRPPAEGLMFFRAFGGHSQNMRALGARGPFREVYGSVLARALASAGERVTAA